MSQPMDLLSGSGGVSEEFHLDSEDGFVRVMVKEEREADVHNISGMFHLHRGLLTCLDSVLLHLEDSATFQGLW